MSNLFVFSVLTTDLSSLYSHDLNLVYRLLSSLVLQKNLNQNIRINLGARVATTAVNHGDTDYGATSVTGVLRLDWDSSPNVSKQNQK